MAWTANLTVESSDRQRAGTPPWARHPEGGSMPDQVPLVDYLVLGANPHLRAHECTQCGARFFDRRNACASCFATEFKDVDIATEGELKAYTIVSLAAP